MFAASSGRAVLRPLAAGLAAGALKAQHSHARDPARCEAPTTGVWTNVRKDVAKLLDADLPDTSYAGATPGPFMIRLGWHSSGTFCAKTGTGGSDGATMRHEPEIGWGANAGLSKAQALLDPILKKYPGISAADLWVFAAGVAVEEMGGPDITFTPGRTDKPASKCPAWESPTAKEGLLPNADLGSKGPPATAEHLRYVFNRMGFDDREIVALSGAHSLGACHRERSGFWGPWTRAPTTMSNEYFRELIENTWTIKTTHKGKPWDGPIQFEDPTGDLMMLPTDIVLIQDAAFRKHVEAYAKNQDLFFNDFKAAFEKLMNLGFAGAPKKGWFW
jgi:cytochrome c peroxidase